MNQKHDVELPKEPTYQERAANQGVEITLKRLGKVVVRELTLENTIRLARELSVVFSKIDINLTAPGERKGFEWMMSLLGDEHSLEAIRSVAAATTEKSPKDFENLGLNDWLKMLGAFKVVMDWEELKDLFFQVVPPELLKNLMSTKQKGQ